MQRCGDVGSESAVWDLSAKKSSPFSKRAGGDFSLPPKARSPCTPLEKGGFIHRTMHGQALARSASPHLRVPASPPLRVPVSSLPRVPVSGITHRFP
jgi:hypothetical protein